MLKRALPLSNRDTDQPPRTNWHAPTLSTSCPQQRLNFLLGPAISIVADRAPTCQAGDHRRTKLSGREARVWLGDHDPPTLRDTAERSARALSEKSRDRNQLHPGL